MTQTIKLALMGTRGDFNGVKNSFGLPGVKGSIKCP
jgi:hypothetical protein